MKRLFIAVRIHPDRDFLARFRSLKQELRQEKIKWVEEHNIHVTLKFLGDTETGKIPLINGILSNISLKEKPFRIRLRSTGVFGSRYDPRVVWTGIEPYETLLELMKKVHSGLREAGFEPDRQNLVPHLTLGRIREIRDKSFFQQTLERVRDISSQEMTVNEFILYESILKKEGPVYLSLGVFALGG